MCCIIIELATTLIVQLLAYIRFILTPVHSVCMSLIVLKVLQYPTHCLSLPLLSLCMCFCLYFSWFVSFVTLCLCLSLSVSQSDSLSLFLSLALRPCAVSCASTMLEGTALLDCGLSFNYVNMHRNTLLWLVHIPCQCQEALQYSAVACPFTMQKMHCNALLWRVLPPCEEALILLLCPVPLCGHSYPNSINISLFDF